MHERIAMALVLTGLIACAIGCKKEVDQAEFKSAINKSFTGRHECVWPEPIKLPAQADPSKDEKTRDYDALTDAGLLIRSTMVKTRLLVGSKLVNNYDLSDKGRPAWISRSQPARLRQLLLWPLQCHCHRQSHPQRPLKPHAIHRELQLRG